MSICTCGACNQTRRHALCAILARLLDVVMEKAASALFIQSSTLLYWPFTTSSINQSIIYLLSIRVSVFVFYRAALNARRSSYEKAVCPSVWLTDCPSVKRVDYDKTEEKSVQIFIPYKRSFSLVLWEEECLWSATLFHLKFWVKLTLLER